jgi:hypothetical protein
VLLIVGAVILVVILAAILIPGQIVSQLARDEASAMQSLHALRDLELRYAAAHPSKGFTCDFALLKTEAPSNGERIDTSVPGKNRCTCLLYRPNRRTSLWREWVRRELPTAVEPQMPDKRARRQVKSAEINMSGNPPYRDLRQTVIKVCLGKQL